MMTLRIAVEFATDQEVSTESVVSLSKFGTLTINPSDPVKYGYMLFPLDQDYPAFYQAGTYYTSAVEQIIGKDTASLVWIRTEIEVKQ